MKQYSDLSAFPFKAKLSTRWKDLDAFGHINNAVYLSYIENARVQLFNLWNITFSGKSIMVVSAQIDYVAQLFHPESLDIGQKVTRVGTKSFDITSGLYKEDGTLACHAIVTCVCFDFNKNKSVPVYPKIIETFHANNKE